MKKGLRLYPAFPEFLSLLLSGAFGTSQARLGVGEEMAGALCFLYRLSLGWQLISCSRHSSLGSHSNNRKSQ